MNTLVPLCLFSVCAVGLPSQQTFLVGPGGLPQIRDALAVAAAGDEIVVQPGTYAQFACSLPVTIRAQVPGTVRIDYNPAFLTTGCSLVCLMSEGPTYIAPQGPGTAHLIGLQFLPGVRPLTPTITARHRVLISAGTVHFDRCSFAAMDIAPLTIFQASVHLQDCQATTLGFQTPSSAIRATLATLSAVQSEAVANQTLLATNAANGSGVELIDSRLHGSHLRLVGNSGSSGTGGAALSVQANSRAVLTDSTLVAGNTQCPVLADVGTVALDRCVLSSAATGCNQHAANEPLLSAQRSQPLRSGQTTTLQFTTAPQAPVFVYAAFEVGPAATFPLLPQAFWIGGSTLQFANLLVSDLQGQSQLPLPVPAQPGLLGLPLFCQGVTASVAGLQLSPVVGGKIE